MNRAENYVECIENSAPPRRVERVLLFLGRSARRRSGARYRLLFAVVTNFVLLVLDKIVLEHMQAQQVGPQAQAVPGRQPPAARGPAAAALLHIIPQASPNAFATGRSRTLSRQPPKGSCRSERRRAGRRAGPRAGARQAPRHPHQLGRRDARGGDRDGVAIAVFFGGGRRDDRDAAIRSQCWRRSSSPPIAAMLIQAGDPAVARGVRRRRRRRAVIAGRSAWPVSACESRRRRGRPLDANPPRPHMFIIKPFSVSGLLGLFSTHPPTDQRIQALLNNA